MPKLPDGMIESIAALNADGDGDAILRPYTAHKIELKAMGGESIGDCPFCGKRKFYISHSSGLWQCKVCGLAGNPLTFIRSLWEYSLIGTTASQYQDLANDRNLLHPSSLKSWGLACSAVDGSWLLPGFDMQGKMTQLYRKTKQLNNGEWVSVLMPTPGIWPSGKAHAIHGPCQGVDPKKPEIDFFEGPWDGVAAWEIMKSSRLDGDDLILTGSEKTSLLAKTDVFSVPGCNVFRPEWVAACKGKIVTLWYDSDHPIVRAGKTMQAGLDGARRIAAMLKGWAKAVRMIRWGNNELGYDPSKKDGYDVRDELSYGKDLSGRQDRLAGLIRLIGPMIGERVGENLQVHVAPTTSNDKAIQPEKCEDWATLEAGWQKALRWRPVIGSVLSTSVAVVTSTPQAGNQLFLQIIGDAGSGKTQICDGLLTSTNCHALEHITGFHSGKKDGDENKDYSLISRINMKALVTPEGDVLMSSPKFAEIMSQIRRIFDGATSATYKNSDKDTRHVGLRTPWVMAGTFALLDVDQSRLGDRFLKIIMTPPDEDEKRMIMRSALKNEKEAVRVTADGSAGACLNPTMKLAQGLTGGYIDYLRKCISDLLPEIKMSDDADEACLDLAEFAADLRARPNTDPKKTETHDSKELPTRLASQFGRMAMCQAVVLNKKEVDADIMQRVKKIALDTSYGRSLDIVRIMNRVDPRTGYSYNERGLPLVSLATFLSTTETKLIDYLNFLKKIRVVDFCAAPQTKGTWKLTERAENLYKKICSI